MRVKVIPHIENLRNKDSIWFLDEKIKGFIYQMIIRKDLSILNGSEIFALIIIKQYLGNTFNSVGFEELISETINERQ